MGFDQLPTIALPPVAGWNKGSRNLFILTQSFGAWDPFPAMRIFILVPSALCLALQIEEKLREAEMIFAGVWNFSWFSILSLFISRFFTVALPCLQRQLVLTLQDFLVYFFHWYPEKTNKWKWKWLFAADSHVMAHARVRAGNMSHRCCLWHRCCSSL